MQQLTCTINGNFTDIDPSERSEALLFFEFSRNMIVKNNIIKTAVDLNNGLDETLSRSEIREIEERLKDVETLTRAINLLKNVDVLDLKEHPEIDATEGGKYPWRDPTFTLWNQSLESLKRPVGMSEDLFRKVLYYNADWNSAELSEKEQEWWSKIYYINKTGRNGEGLFD